MLKAILLPVTLINLHNCSIPIYAELLLYAKEGIQKEVKKKYLLNCSAIGSSGQ